MRLMHLNEIDDASHWISYLTFPSPQTQGGNGAAPRIFQTMNNWQDPAIDAYEPATAGMTEMRDIDILDPLDQGQAEQPLLARPFDKHQRAHKLNRLFLLAEIGRAHV